jgi:hypothetical protein
MSSVLMSFTLSRRVVPDTRKFARVRCPIARAAVQTPSSATAANVLQRLQEYTVLLDDNPLDVISAPRDAKSSAALVNHGLLSHILANTSAFYEFAVRVARQSNSICTTDYVLILLCRKLKRARKHAAMGCQGSSTWGAPPQRT